MNFMQTTLDIVKITDKLNTFNLLEPFVAFCRNLQCGPTVLLVKEKRYF